MDSLEGGDKIRLCIFRMTATWNSLHSAIFTGGHLFSQELRARGVSLSAV